MAALRTELGVPETFPPEVDAAVRAAVAGASTEEPSGGRGAAGAADRPDRTGVALVTIDPPGSRDLDQAYGAERRPGGGVRVWYAIADVAAFVPAGGAIDAEAQRRGVTFYGPDRRIPLHPPDLSEGAASLLPDGDRPALLWCIDLDEAGAPVATRCERALVRSRAQLTYAEVSRAVAAGTADEPLTLLRTIGELRIAAEIARGGVSLPIPDQVIEPGAGADLRLAYDAPVPAEAWNAQVSLLTGMEAARVMLAGGVGVLRTLPPADERTLARLRRSARALGVAWPEAGGYPAFVRSLDPATATGAALLVQAARVLRGAGYVGFRDGTAPEAATHAAVAAPYAHVTAPLRRLCDRAANEVVLALLAGAEVPEWAQAAVEVLPDVMAESGRARGGLLAGGARPGRGAGAAPGGGPALPRGRGRCRRRRRARPGPAARAGGGRPCPDAVPLRAGRRGGRARAGRRPGGPARRARGGVTVAAIGDFLAGCRRVVGDGRGGHRSRGHGRRRDRLDGTLHRVDARRRPPGHDRRGGRRRRPRSPASRGPRPPGRQHGPGRPGRCRWRARSWSAWAGSAPSARSTRWPGRSPPEPG